MVTFVSGPRDSGKTAEMLTLYERGGRGDGFISQKVMENGKILAYEVRRLSSGETAPLAYDHRYVPEDWEETLRHGRYSFGSPGLELAVLIVEELLSSGTTPIFMDEIGKLELKGLGFAPLLRSVVQTGTDLVLAVRDINVEAVAREFGIQDYKTHSLS